MKRPIENDDTDKLWTNWAKVLSCRLQDMDPAEADVRTERFDKRGRLFFVMNAPQTAAPPTVRFAEKKDVVFIPSAKEFTMQEKVDTWHTVSAILYCVATYFIARWLD